MNIELCIIVYLQENQTIIGGNYFPVVNTSTCKYAQDIYSDMDVSLHMLQKCEAIIHSFKCNP